ncbi:hypothetical protein [Streptomyces sp. KAU_LT]|uniref:hypothetical protein n=1 Tax=unclassified Streptomyces TaxID=2593676 RepID=UPI0024B7656D|nr:hypothetical protein [Streptomyces sp. KAU_LT]MDI9831156.1 hypothetical protein [Streptomyces sp. KAU_LT]
MKRRLNRPNRTTRPSRSGLVAAASVFTGTTAAALFAVCPVTVSVTVAADTPALVVGQQNAPIPQQRPVCPTV